MVAAVLRARQEIVPRDSAAAQARHERELVPAGHARQALPPHQVQDYDVRIVVEAENDVVLHQGRTPPHPLEVLPDPDPEQPEQRYIVMGLQVYQ